MAYKFTKEEIDQMKIDYENGVSLTDIAKKNFTHYMAVRRAIAGEGVEIRTPSESQKLKTKTIPEEWLHMAKLHEQGQTYKIIGNRYEMDPSAVRYRIKEVRKRLESGD